MDCDEGETKGERKVRWNEAKQCPSWSPPEGRPTTCKQTDTALRLVVGLAGWWRRQKRLTPEQRWCWWWRWVEVEEVK